MPEILKDMKLIDTLCRLLRAAGTVRIVLTVVIIAFSVITGAKYFLAPSKTVKRCK